MLTCQQLIAFLSDYVDGKLPLTQRAAFELHLALCRDCRSYLHNFKSTIEATRAAFDSPDAPIPESVPESLVQSILQARRQ